MRVQMVWGSSAVGWTRTDPLELPTSAAVVAGAHVRTVTFRHDAGIDAFSAG